MTTREKKEKIVGQIATMFANEDFTVAMVKSVCKEIICMWENSATIPVASGEQIPKTGENA